MVPQAYPPDLTAIGLSADETAIYTSLLYEGPQGASQLARNTGVKRTYVYAVCASLVAKSLATKTIKGKSAVFSAQNPTQLQLIAQQRSQQASSALFDLERSLPELITKYTSNSVRPVITYLEGVEGVKKAYLDTIATPSSTMCSLVRTATVEPVLYNWLTTTYVKDRVTRQVKVKAIVATGDKSQIYVGLDQKELRDTKVIDGDKFPIEHEICIYQGKVNLIHHRQGTPLLAIIIAHPLIAATFQTWFNLTWSQLPQP